MSYLSTMLGVCIGFLGFPMVQSWSHIPIGSHIHNLHVPTTIVVAMDQLIENGVENVGNMRGILDSYYLSYFFRQNLYGTVLSDSHMITHMFHIIQNSLNQFDVFYLGIFTFTIGLFMKDLSYKKKIDKLLENGTLSRRTTRALEIFIIIASMVLFKDVDVATGDVGFPLYAFVH